MRTALLALLAVTASVASAADDFFFKPGERVMFLGDSITEQYQYSTYIELYLTTRFPDAKMTFLNAGISGDTAGGGANRFKNHVLAEKPTVVTINFGMNDGGYGAYDAKRSEAYARNTESMIKAAKEAGVRVALFSPNAVEARVADRFNLYLETQKQFYAPLAGLAEKYNLPFVDQYAVTRVALTKMAADKCATKAFPDGVHTNGPGGLLMAHTILTGLKAPAFVSQAAIDAEGARAKSDGCTIANVEVKDGAVSFERTDSSIPMPVQKDWVGILPYVNNLADLNRCSLAVVSLKPGSYAVSIDGVEVGKWSHEDLAKGIDLGLLTSGPIYDQGQKVLAAINAKNKIVHDRFRGVVMYTNPPAWLADVVAERRPAELAKRMTQADALQAEIYTMVKPKAHKFVIKPAKQQ